MKIALEMLDKLCKLDCSLKLSFYEHQEDILKMGFLVIVLAHPSHITWPIPSNPQVRDQDMAQDDFQIEWSEATYKL